MTLYEIERELANLIAEYENAVDDDGQMLWDTDELDSRFAELEMAREQKILNTAAYIKNVEAEAEAIRSEEIALAKRRKTNENLANRLRALIERNAQGEKFKNARVQISWRKSEAVSIIGEVPEMYSRVKIEPDKSKIKDELKKGAELPFAILEEKQNLQIK